MHRLMAITAHPAFVGINAIWLGALVIIAVPAELATFGASMIGAGMMSLLFNLVIVPERCSGAWDDGFAAARCWGEIVHLLARAEGRWVDRDRIAAQTSGRAIHLDVGLATGIAAGVYDGFGPLDIGPLDIPRYQLYRIVADRTASDTRGTP